MINASGEAQYHAQRTKDKKLYVYGFYPIDPPSCSCAKQIYDFKESLLLLPPTVAKSKVIEQRFLTCNRDKTGMTRYEISCKACKQVQGYVWAKDKTLKDWCDFHYVQWSDGEYWYGCLTPHVSPIDSSLCLQCCCGVDTRDFRANMTIPHKQAKQLEDDNKHGRKYDGVDSKFLVRAIRTVPILKKDLWQK